MNRLVPNLARSEVFAILVTFGIWGVMMSNDRSLLGAAVAVVLAGCALPMLKEDGYNASKYGLPPVLHPGDSKTLTLDEKGEAWAFIPAVKGEYYEVSAGGPANGAMSFYHADKTTAYLTNASTNAAQGFVASATENVFVKLVKTGSVSKKYNTSCVSFPALVSGEWLNGDIEAGEELWWAVPVIAGFPHAFDVNDYYGDGTKTGRPDISVFKADRETLIDWDDESSPNFVPSGGRFAFVKATIGFYEDAGTFAIRFQSPVIAPLTAGAWHDDTISWDQKKWYSFPVTEGQMYDVSIQQFGEGDGSKTAQTVLTVAHQNGSGAYIASAQNTFATPATFLADRTETAVVSVLAYWSGGTFALRYQPTPP